MRTFLAVFLSVAMITQTIAAAPLQETTKLDLKLPSSAIKIIQQRLNHETTLLKSVILPQAIQLGMNEVPVLDQGIHRGAESVFAITGALDAVLNAGDWISQLCLLQLGNYMKEHAHTPSGWEGTLIPQELKRVESYGIVSKDQQQMIGCGEETKFPLHSVAPFSAMSFEQYHALSEDLSANNIVWSPILDIHQAFEERFNTQKTLEAVKKALGNGHRVISTFLAVNDEKGIGAQGAYHVTGDTWTLSTTLKRNLFINPVLMAHILIITGYDDQAIAVDENGKTHQGLLTLRASWGEKAGDHGNFYMTYDYYRTLVADAYQIISVDVTDDDSEDRPIHSDL